MLIHRLAAWREIFPTSAAEQENRLIWLKVGSEWPMFALAANTVVDLLPQGGSQCFPLYTYDPNSSKQRDNITDRSVEAFCSHYGYRTVSKPGIFYYIYALLHHPAYRERFAENLKRELPRIPFAPDFPAFVKAGRDLARLHLNYEQLDPYPLKFIEDHSHPFSFRVIDKMRLSKDRTSLAVNPSLTLAGLPPEAFEYRLGNRSALEWVIDQYRVTEDARSGVRSDPNRADDPEYIVRLVGQVIRVSVDTLQIVKSLPVSFS